VVTRPADVQRDRPAGREHGNPPGQRVHEDEDSLDAGDDARDRESAPPETAGEGALAVLHDKVGHGATVDATPRPGRSLASSDWSDHPGVPDGPEIVADLTRPARVGEDRVHARPCTADVCADCAGANKAFGKR